MTARWRSSGRKADIADWFYVPSWERSPLPAVPAPGEKKGKENGNCWLVFSSPGHFISRLLEQLEQLEQLEHPEHPGQIKPGTQDLVMVKPGERFACENSSHYVLDPRDGESYHRLFKALSQAGKRPDRILHLWGISGDSEKEQQSMSRWEQLDFSLDRGLYSLIHIVQAMGKQTMTHTTGIFVLTDGMQEVIGDELLSPAKAVVLGAIKVIPREYANITCCSIDIVLPAGGSPGEDRLVNRLTEELARDISQPVVAWRGNHRWVPIIKPHPLPPPSAGKSAPVFRQQGVYLITGGCGGIGFTLAGYLASRFKARLLLTGRTAVPTDENAGSDKMMKIRQLESLGARVLVFNADTADLRQMETAINAAENQFGPIQGVIHAAGVADYAGVIQRRTKDMTRAVLAPKVQGTLVLDELLTHRNLDFFIMCSSISSFLGPLGQVGYTAANTFLDAFALYQTHCRQVLTQSINWGAWQQVGMAVEAAKHRNTGKISGITETLEDDIAPDEGIDIFERTVHWRLPQVAVYPKDLQVRLHQPDHWSPANEPSLTPGTGPASPIPLQPRPELGTVYVKPQNRIQNIIAETWQEYLGIQEIGIHDNFFDLGATSLDLMHVTGRLNKILEKKIPVVTMFAYPTIHSFYQAIGSPDPAGEEDKEQRRNNEIREGKRMLQQMLQKSKERG